MVETSVEVNGIHTAYGKHQVLDNLTVAPLTSGKVVGLLGPNACGKSTLLKTIAGVHKPQLGTVRVTLNGKQIAPKEHFRHIGYVPQDLPGSAALTAFETVMVSASRDSSSHGVENLAAEVMCDLKISHLAHRYLSELSGGQRQMVAFAQMLVAKPAVMLLDEPTSALDLNKQLFLLARVREQVRATGALALVAIHDINLSARFCDELLVMKEGTLQAQGSPRDLLTPELLRAVFEVETEILHHGDTPVIATVS